MDSNELLFRIDEKLTNLIKATKEESDRSSTEFENIWKQIKIVESKFDLVNEKVIQNSIATKIGTWVIVTLTALLLANLLPKIIEKWIT